MSESLRGSPSTFLSRPRARFLLGFAVACLVAAALLAAAASATAQEDVIAARDARVSLAWGDCPFDSEEIEEDEGLRVRCGRLTVPESRESEDDRTLGIAFTVAEPEDGARGEPVVLMPGGPGMTVVPRGLRLLRRWGVGERPLVVFDVRGTGHSGPLMCTGLSVTESDVASMDLSLAEARTLERGAYLACRDELLNRGIDLEAYRSAAVARDVRSLREALGYERWNVLGGSYGVRLGLAVLREDPDAVRSATFLAGPHPHPEMLVTRDVPFFARSLELFFDLCAGDPACASRHPRLEEDLYATYEALAAEAWTVPVDPESFRRPAFTVNAQDFIRLVYETLGSDGDLPRLPGLIRAFRDRDEAAAAAVLEDEYGGLTSTFSTGLMYAVDCNDAYTPRSRAQREAAAEGHPAALDDIRYFLAPCPDWPDPAPAPGERTPVRSDVPALVVTAEMDPMSPPATGEEHLRYLENGHHFVVPDASHGMAFNPRTAPCVAELIGQFLDDPDRRPDGSCLDELERRRLLSAGHAAERPGPTGSTHVFRPIPTTPTGMCVP